ncbi:hypothetical protein B1790_25640 [Mycobacterium sp. AT1]|nr:hypothetical protein B1790_25640 [Mycobacterium sp. AT1]
MVVADGAAEVDGPAAARGGTSAGAVAVKEEDEVPGRAAGLSVGWRRVDASAERAVAGSSGRAG